VAKFDVFLSYSSQDRATVDELDALLGARSLRVWYDQREILPGDNWMQKLEHGLRESAAVAVCIGSNSLGPWQRPEMEAAIRASVERTGRVIPLLLPGVSPRVEMNLFLAGISRVEFPSGLNDRTALDRLHQGISEAHYKNWLAQQESSSRRLPDAVAARSGPVATALTKLKAVLPSTRLVFLVGPGIYDGNCNLPPTDAEITPRLLANMPWLPQPAEGAVLPPLDIVGDYYALQETRIGLENKIVQLIENRSKTLSPVHKELAAVVATLAAQPVRRGQEKPVQLIVTTNLDVMIERALLLEGVPFLRVVQTCSEASGGTQIEGAEYRGSADSGRIHLAGGDPVGIPATDLDAIDNAIAAPERKVLQLGSQEANRPLLRSFDASPGTSVVLYKFRGSLEIQQSCAIATSQYLDLSRRLLRANLLPTQLVELIGNSPLLFIGYHFLDPDFRFTYYTWLRDALELKNVPRFAVQLPPEERTDNPYRRMESGVWEGLKAEFQTQLAVVPLEIDPLEFLRQLRDVADRLVRAA
jgi:hypothetical protein